MSFRKQYNWGGNYTRLDTEIEVVPPAYLKVLCIRDMERVVGWQSQSGDFISFREYAKFQAMGIAPNDVIPKSEQRCVFTLDTYKGPAAPWMHVGSGEYRGFYRLPPVTNELWREGGSFDTGKLYLVVLNKPSTIASCGYDFMLPGIYLAQAYKGEDGFKNWAVHQPGFRFRSTDQFAVMPKDLKIPDISVDFWMALPDLMNKHSFR